MRAWNTHGFPLLLSVVIGLTAAAARPAHAEAATAPSVRLIAASPSVTLYRHGREVPLDLGVYVASVGGDFELHVRRPDYEAPTVLSQVNSGTGQTVRSLPTELLDGWLGLRRFIRVAFLNSSGIVVAAKRFRFCPNSFLRQRVDDGGPALPRYPEFCDGHSPFLKGMVWGIDAHWAAGALNSGFDEMGGPSLRVPNGRYTVSVRIADSYARALAIPPEHAEITVAVTVKPARAKGLRRVSATASDASDFARSVEVPSVTDPQPSTLPDLVALPAWAMRVSHRKGRDYLSFAASIWNAGPGALVVEGFRRPGERVMDAFQYFYGAAGNPTGREPVGTFAYDARPRHQHWHFLQFASFQILDRSKAEVVRSRKQAFCLLPTDAIDLTVRGSNWAPWSVGLRSACGGQSALWVREALDVGWADTYHQNVPGQSFDITRVQNGWYHVRVQVNPTGALRESSIANNEELRLIRLGGRQGARKLIVRPWLGIGS